MAPALEATSHRLEMTAEGFRRESPGDLASGLLQRREFRDGSCRPTARARQGAVTKQEAVT